MLAAETNCPAATAAPESVRLPAPGRVVTLTLDSALAGASFGSVKPKSATLKVYAVSSLVVTVLLVPTGASLIAVPVIALLPVNAGATPSLTLEAMLKPLL